MTNKLTCAVLGACVTLAVLVALPPAAGQRPVAPAPRAVQDRGGMVPPSDEPLPVEPGGPDYSIPPGELIPTVLEHLPQDTDVADWGHLSIDVPGAWKVTKGKGATVAVLDTGCDMAHPDLKEQIVGAKNFTGSRNGASDVQGHGTHCAGIVLAAENSSGMIGVAPHAKLIVGKVLGDNGSGASTWIAAGIDWAAENGADVISMSLGGPGPDQYTRAAVQRALAKGVIVVAAAGNEGPREGTVGYPGGYPECVCVAAIDSQLRTAGFSSRGAAVRVAAPGVSVRSCYPGGRFATMSGTSMATPYVAGCAALYVSAKKARGEKADPAEFFKLIQEQSRDLPPSGRDTATGFGLIQPAKLVGPPVVVPPPKDGDPPPPSPDRIEVVIPGLTVGGRPVQRLVIEFPPVKP